MERFYFHFIDDETILLDFEGLQLNDVGAAFRRALYRARNFLSEEVSRGRFPLDARIDIENEHGAIVSRLYFYEAVRFCWSGPFGKQIAATPAAVNNS